VLASADGAVLKCDVTQSSGNAALDAGACQMLRDRPELVSKRGRSAGVATGVREVTQRVTWKLKE
jgi:outer membrane biosynthesis protein TonB